VRKGEEVCGRGEGGGGFARKIEKCFGPGTFLWSSKEEKKFRPKYTSPEQEGKKGNINEQKDLPK